MTPKFTTACYVRIEDADKRKEVCEQLERIRYKNTWHSPLKNQIIVANTSGTYVDVLSVDNTDMINCGINIDLFLALAVMREDTDKDQIFTNSKGEFTVCRKHDIFEQQSFDFEELKLLSYMILTKIRRATATEIINYHKQKGE